MQLTQKTRIYPLPKQKRVLWGLSEKRRLIYNFALKDRQETYSKDEKITDQIQENALVLTKKTHPDYTRVHCNILQMTLNALDSNYHSFFALHKNGDLASKPPCIKSKNFFITMVYNQNGFKIEHGRVKLSHKHPSDVLLCFANRVSFRFGKVYQVKVSQESRGHFFVSVVYEAKALPLVDNGLYQAFDLSGINHVAVNSYSKFAEFSNARHDLHWNVITSYLQSRRDRRKRKSNRWHHWDRAFRKRKCVNQTRDLQYKLSRRIISNTRANIIIVGDLNMKGIAQSPMATNGLNRSKQNNANLCKFVRFLSYKGELMSKQVVEINEAFTSKQCCVCGKMHDIPVWKRTLRGCFGNVVDRDKNSVVNIIVRFLSQVALWMGYSIFWSNLRKTGFLAPQLEVYLQEANHSWLSSSLTNSQTILI